MLVANAPYGCVSEAPYRGVCSGARDVRMEQDCAVVVHGEETACVALCRGECVVERVSPEGAVDAVGVAYIRTGDVDGVCLAVATPAFADTPPIVTTYLPIGPVVTRMTSCNTVTTVCGVPGCGLMILGEGIGVDGEPCQHLSHTLHPLSVPKPLSGVWSHAEAVLLLAVRPYHCQAATVFVVSSHKGTTVLSCLEMLSLDTRTSLERKPSIRRASGTTGDIALPGIKTCVGGKLLEWGLQKSPVVVVFSPRNGAMVLTTHKGVRLLTVEDGVQDVEVTGEVLVTLTKGTATTINVYVDPQVMLYSFPLTGPVVRLRNVTNGVLVAQLQNGEERGLSFNTTIACPLTRIAVDLLTSVLDSAEDRAGLMRHVLSHDAQIDQWQAFHEFLAPSEPAAGGSAYDRLRVLRARNGSSLNRMHLGAQPRASGQRLDASSMCASVCALHLMHESMRSTLVWRQSMPRVALLVSTLSHRAGWGLWVEHYAALYEHLHTTTSLAGTPLQPPLQNDPRAQTMLSQCVRHAAWFSEVASPPDLMAYVETAVSLRCAPHRAFPHVPLASKGSSATASARVLLQLVDLRCGLSGERYLREESGTNVWPPKTLHESAVGVLLPAVDGVHAKEVTRAISSLSLGPAFLLLQSAATCREDPSSEWDPRLLSAIGRPDVALLSLPFSNVTCLPLQPLADYENHKMMPSKPPRAEAVSITGDALGVDVGNGPPSIGHRLLWSKDARLATAQSLLCSAVPIVLTGGDDDVADPVEQQEQLATIANRVLALPCGRGMLTLTTMANLSGSTLPQPPIVLCGRRAKEQGFTSLDLTGYAVDTTLWPEFLNGCSAALRLQTMEHLGSKRVYIRDWIANAVSPNAAPTSGTAGIVLGLGLLGHLELLTGSELYSLMFPRHEATTVALLVGLSACHRGTGEKRVSGMLSLHLAPITPHYAEQDVAPGMQAAALIGTGLLYQGTCHRLMADMLLGELSRPPSDEHSSNLHSYALCTGFALGLICLGKGGEANHLSDLKLMDRLLALLTCTKRDAMDPHSGAEAKLPVRIGDDGPGTGIPLSMHRRANRAQVCSKVMVGPLIDTNVTAPAAAAALGLMFMRTNNPVVVNALRLPTTAALLLSVSPDAVLLRIIAAALVDWDSIEATETWLASMSPSVMHRIVARHDGTMGLGARQHLLLLHANAVGACMFALGLKYAGSENTVARDLILQELNKLLNARVGRGKEGSCNIFGDDASPNRKLMDPAINAAMLAASCVMAGTGCAEVFKVHRTLQKRKDDTYGSHMAAGMAIGLLFLGAGHRTLASTPQSVAALLMSLYPRFPTVATDNTYHPQFLRPLYALATIPRILETRDVDTGETCPVEVVVNGTAKAVSPCVLPRGENVTVEVVSKEYFKARLSKNVPEQRSAIESGVIWVKKRTHAEDTGLYRACFGAGPLHTRNVLGADPKLVEHSLGAAAARSAKGSLHDTFDVRLVAAAHTCTPSQCQTSMVCAVVNEVVLTIFSFEYCGIFRTL